MIYVLLFIDIVLLGINCLLLAQRDGSTADRLKMLESTVYHYMKNNQAPTRSESDTGRE